MEKAYKNNFGKRGGELMPRELMERIADSAFVPDGTFVAVLLKSGVLGENVIEFSRCPIGAFGFMKSIVSGDWRTLEERIKGWSKTSPDRPIKGLGRVKCLEPAAAFAAWRTPLRPSLATYRAQGGVQVRLGGRRGRIQPSVGRPQAQQGKPQVHRAAFVALAKIAEMRLSRMKRISSFRAKCCHSA